MTSLSLAHRAWRLLPVRARRAAFLRATTWMAPRPDPVPPRTATCVTVAGEINRASGLGQGARIMAAAIEASGVAVVRQPAGLLRGETVELGQAPTAPSPPGSLLVAHLNPPDLPAAFIRLGAAALRSRRVVGYWAWELPVAPGLWQRPARLVHEAWVPSRFTADALEPLLPGRIRVVPHALTASPPRPSARTRADFGLPENTLLVMVSFSLASSFERKNPLGAIAAFRGAFGDSRDHHLLLKVGKAGHFPADLRRLQEAVGGSPNITIDTGLYSTADTHAMTRAADVVLSLHRSEGFGLVPAEAMMLGRPVVATDWSATAEFLDAASGIPIPARLVAASDPRSVFEAPGAVWAEPCHAHAVEALRLLAGDHGLRARFGEAAMARATRQFGDGPLRAALVAAGVGVP